MALLGAFTIFVPTADVTCNFQDTGYGYSCPIFYANLTDDGISVNFIGEHSNYSNNNDVVLAGFSDSTLHFIPNAIFSIK